MSQKYLLLAALLITACTATPTIEDGGGDTPDPTIELDDYLSLKSYAPEGLKLGIAVNAEEYATKGALYALANENFNEVVSSYHMKHELVVGSDGSMNFDVIDSFIDAAQQGGVEIFGHTLCWYAGQNVAYLNGLISPATTYPDDDPATEWTNLLSNSDFESDTYDTSTIQPYDANDTDSYSIAYEDGSHVLKIVNTTASSTNNDGKLLLKPAGYLQSREYYKLTMDIKSENGSPLTDIKIQQDASPWGEILIGGSIETSTQWQTKELIIDLTEVELPGSDILALCYGTYADTYYIDNCYLSVRSGVESGISWQSVDSDIYGWSGNQMVYDDKSDDDIALIVTNATAQPDATSSAQVKIDLGIDNLFADNSYKVTVRMKSNSEDEISLNEWSLAAQGVSPDGGWADGFGEYYISSLKLYDFVLTNEYQDFTFTLNSSLATEPQNYQYGYQIVFNFGGAACTLYVESVSIEKRIDNSQVTQTEMSDTEKDEAISGAMRSWLSGILTQTKGKVEAWDIINEPINNAWPYSLRSNSRFLDDDYFYWSDYISYPDIIKMAREIDPTIKLFVNDYYLEVSDDDNGKCQSLISYIEEWESEGATIDGIGTQMHTSYNRDQTIQSSNEQGVERMFELLAATGKLIRISELDIALSDGSATIYNDQTTDDDLLSLANYYKFIISKYIELIPAAQRYGITHWNPIDNSNSEEWRCNEPAGLWHEDYTRKITYKGYLEGLQ